MAALAAALPNAAAADAAAAAYCCRQLQYNWPAFRLRLAQATLYFRQFRWKKRCKL
jgi:hypothetical protein